MQWTETAPRATGSAWQHDREHPDIKRVSDFYEEGLKELQWIMSPKKVYCEYMEEWDQTVRGI